MNRTILYYPTIDIPSNDWLKHAVLYWDEVSSIVPDDKKLRNRLSGALDYLRHEGHFRPIHPETLVHQDNNWEVLQEFSNEVKNVVGSKEFESFLFRKNRISRPSQSKLKNAELIFTEIHSNKTTYSLVEFLRERGLIRRTNQEWIEMEQTTALLYMSILAKYLADMDADQTTISTNLSSYEQFNFKRVSSKQGTPVISFNLNRVLPTPASNVPIEKIVEFKRNREDNLLHFKRMLSEFNVKASKAKSQGELNELTITFSETLKAGVMDLSAVLKDAKIEHRFKTIKSMINIKSPAGWLTAGALLGKALHVVNIPVSIPAIAFAVTGFIDVRTNFVENKNKERLKLRESPFSYIYQAQQFGIIKKF